MNPENKLWLDILDDPAFKNDRLIINKMKDQPYETIRRHVSFEAITKLHQYLVLHKKMSDDPMLQRLFNRIENDVLIIKENINGYWAKEVVSRAIVKGNETARYYYLHFGDYHTVIGFKVLFAVLGQDYALFYTNNEEPLSASPGFESVEKLVEYWKVYFYDRIEVEWPPEGKEWLQCS